MTLHPRADIHPRRHIPAHECADHRLYHLSNGITVTVRPHLAITSTGAPFSFHTEAELEDILDHISQWEVA